jgi:hypothetical protein
MGKWLLSRRDRLIVARHEVPGKHPSKEPSRRVRNDRAQLVPQVFRDHFYSAERYRIRNFLRSNLRIRAHTCANHTVPYGTGLLGCAGPRHFVPGYDHAVAPGRKTFRAEALIELARIG